MKRYKLKLDVLEIKVLITALNEWRNKLIREGNHDEFVDDLLLKIINVLEK